MARIANESSTVAEFETAVFELIRRRVGIDIGYFWVRGGEASPAAFGLDGHLVERAIRRAPRYQQDLLPVKEAALLGRGVAVDTRVLGERRVRRTAYYRDVVNPAGGRHTLMAYVPLRGSIVGAMMLGRAGSEFSDTDIGRIESLLPALGVARASYGLPVSTGPLHMPAASGLSRRFGVGWPNRVLAVEAIGEGTLEVRDQGGFREMVARAKGAELVWTRAALRDASESGWPYVELFHLAAVQAKARRKALFIGCGGAVALRQFSQLYPGLAMDLVQCEPRVLELARAWYDLGKIPGVSVHIADGAAFAERAPSCAWDIAIIDAFDASNVAAPLRQPAFFSALHRLLCPGGALGINLIGTLDGYGAVRDIAGHLSRAFRRIRVVPVMDAHESYSPTAPRNVVLIASKS